MIFKYLIAKIRYKNLIKAGLLLFVFATLSQAAFSQDYKSSTDGINLSGSLSITNDGIAVVPALSLGEPAGILGFSAGNRFRFEPEFKFSLEGIPWSFNFWSRYDVIKTDKFQFTAGMPVFISFTSLPAVVNEVNNETIVARRFVGGELNANYSVGKSFNVGSYYLFSHSFDPTVPDNSHYVSVYSTVSNISLFSDLYLNIRPQTYYLWIDDRDGFYVASGFILGMRGFPLSISSIVNKKLESNIIGSKDLLWNISLNYSFRF